MLEHSQSDYEVVFAIRPAYVPGFSLPEGEGITAIDALVVSDITTSAWKS